MTAPKATRDPAEQYRRKREGLNWPQVFPPAFEHRAKSFQQRPLTTAPQGLKSFVTDTSVMTHPQTRSETKGHPGLELAQSLNRAAD